MSTEKILGVLRAPHISEKTARLQESSQYVFEVASDATKADVKAAIEQMFSVNVQTVNVLNVKGKEKRAGRFMGRRNNWKKAYVRLKPGQEINFAEGEGR